jgi:hypothetical protein
MDFISKIKNELQSSEIVSKIGSVGISPTTIKKYMDKLKYLMFKVDDIPEYLDNIENLNTALAYYGAIFGSVKHSATSRKFFKNDLNNFESKYKILMDKNRTVDSSIKTEKEQENMLDWKEIIKKTSSPELTQNQMLLNIYTLTPPVRLDYNRLFITKNLMIPDNEPNYIQILSKTKTNIILNEYKTSANYGTQTTKLSPKLSKILYAYINANPTKKYLFEISPGIPYTSAQTFGVYLRRIFKDKLGKDISVDILRHSFLTYTRRNDLSKAEKTYLAKSMGHSIATAESYVKN